MGTDNDQQRRNRVVGMIIVGILIVLWIGTAVGAIVLNWNAPWRTVPGGW